MAFISTQYCRRCEKETSHNWNQCYVCKEKDAREAEEAWEALPVEKKLTDLRKRLEEIEGSNQRIR